MINSEVCCHQLDKLNDSLKQKRSEFIERVREGILFHHDNARPYAVYVTHRKLLQLDGVNYCTHHIFQIWHRHVIDASNLFIYLFIYFNDKIFTSYKTSKLA